MNIYLSGISGIKKWLESGEINPGDFYALESFYSIQDWQRQYIPKFRGFMLDSGAFTFLSDNAKGCSVDWLSYADKYSDFILENNIQHFFELDIDTVKDLRYIEMLRDRIEKRTNRKTIPVWHIKRGKDYFVELCKAYRYVAFGGILTDGVRTSILEKHFPWFIATAHSFGTKIHGLGYTNTEGLRRFNFDSVDSTTWTVGARFGEACLFKDGIMSRYTGRRGGQKVMKPRDAQELTVFNFRQWLAYSRYMENQTKIHNINPK